MVNKPVDSNSWRSALALGLIAILGTALLAVVNQLTRDRIDEQERRAVLKQLEQLVPAQRYDNAMHDDVYTFVDSRWFPGDQLVTVYRARRQGQPVAAVFRLLARDGYNGDIRLLVGVNVNGTLAGVRVISHKETPGLGDAIETSRSNWILDFDGRSLDQPQLRDWAVKRDGGVFDQFTGATITPRAVVNAVRRTLEYYADHRDAVFSRLAEPPTAKAN